MTARHVGQFFVIIDKRTGRAVNREIYEGVDAADAALERLGGERRTGFQVMDATWHNPSRARLKASGMGLDGLGGRSRATGPLFEVEVLHGGVVVSRLDPDEFMRAVQAPRTMFLQTAVEQFNSVNAARGESERVRISAPYAARDRRRRRRAG